MRTFPPHPRMTPYQGPAGIRRLVANPKWIDDNYLSLVSKVNGQLDARNLTPGYTIGSTDFTEHSDMMCWSFFVNTTGNYQWIMNSSVNVEVKCLALCEVLDWNNNRSTTGLKSAQGWSNSITVTLRNLDSGGFDIMTLTRAARDRLENTGARWGVMADDVVLYTRSYVNTAAATNVGYVAAGATVRLTVSATGNPLTAGNGYIAYVFGRAGWV